MSEADKMFEELGYKKDIDEIYGTTRDMNLLKAINEKCKELGWLDD